MQLLKDMLRKEAFLSLIVSCSAIVRSTGKFDGWFYGDWNHPFPGNSGLNVGILVVSLHYLLSCPDLIQDSWQ